MKHPEWLQWCHLNEFHMLPNQYAIEASFVVQVPLGRKIALTKGYKSRFFDDIMDSATRYTLPLQIPIEKLRNSSAETITTILAQRLCAVVEDLDSLYEEFE
jgi:hypothetical protein